LIFVIINKEALQQKKTYVAVADERSFLAGKIADYAMLVKMRLSLVVVFSSVLGYLISVGDKLLVNDLAVLVAGGMFVTFAANALNQVLEKDFDLLMARTANRPVATGRMKSSEAVLFAGLACLMGIGLLATLNPLSALLGMISMVIYAFVYTPLKRYSTAAVAVGAVPGALPVLIGATAVDGRITMMAVCLFVIQFLWQFPHFWSIGFLGFDDYKRAGYKLLPETDSEIDRNLGLSSMFYAALILPVVFFAFVRLDLSAISMVMLTIFTLIYIWLGYMLQKNFDRPSAMKLMFWSFLYLPLVLFTVWLM